MRILHITNRLSEGGVESFLLTFLPRLRSLGHQVELLVLDKSAVSMWSMFETQGIRVHIGKYSNIYNLLNVFEVRRYLCFMISYMFIFGRHNCILVWEKYCRIHMQNS